MALPRRYENKIQQVQRKPGTGINLMFPSRQSGKDAENLINGEKTLVCQRNILNNISLI